MKVNECYVCGGPISDDELVTLADEDRTVGYRGELTLHERCVSQFWLALGGLPEAIDPNKEQA